MPIISKKGISIEDDLIKRLKSIEKKFQRAMLKNLYTPFESLRLRFVSTPDCPETNIAGHIWKSNDEHEIDYLSAIGMVEIQFPKNFISIKKPRRAPYGIGRIISPLPQIEVTAFHECHQRICGIWLELDTLARVVYPAGLPYRSEAFCDYIPEKRIIFGRLATYKDLDHLLQAAKNGVRTTRDLRKQLKINNIAGIAVGSQNNARIEQNTAAEDETPNIFEHTSNAYRIRFECSEIYYFNELTGLNYISECLRLRPKTISAKDLFISKYGGLPEEDSHGTYIENESERSSEVFRQKLIELNKRRQMAEDNGDEGEKLKIDEESHMLEKESKRFAKYRGKPRLEFDTFEKYRASISRAISYAYKKLDSKLPDLVSHFRRYLHVGKQFEYIGTIDWRT